MTTFHQIMPECVTLSHYSSPRRHKSHQCRSSCLTSHQTSVPASSVSSCLSDVSFPQCLVTPRPPLLLRVLRGSGPGNYYPGAYLRCVMMHGPECVTTPPSPHIKLTGPLSRSLAGFPVKVPREGTDP